MSDVRVIDPFDAIMQQVLLGYQRDDVVARDRFRWNCWSRQTGKSFGKTFRRIVRGIARKRNQLFLSAGDRQSGELMDKARLHCQTLKLAFEYSEREAGVFEDAVFKQREISLGQAGVRIIGLPANPDTARGFTGDVFLDEFSMHKRDRDIWAAMFPSVMRGQGELDVAATPKGKQNIFYELRQNEAFAHQTVTIHDAIAQGLRGVDPDELRRAIGDDELWRQEFLCEFIDEATAFLTLDVIRSCEDEKLPRKLDMEELRGLRGDVVVGVDVGRYRDLTVIWPFQVIGDQMISLGLLELQSVPFAGQFEVLCDVLSCRCVRRCCIDATGLGMQFAEQAQERYGEYRVERVTFTPLSKEQMAGALRVRMEARNARIPADRQIRDDLHSIEKSVTLDGHIRLRATRTEGSHADRFWAAALAAHALGNDCGPIECKMGPVLAAAGGRFA